MLDVEEPLLRPEFGCRPLILGEGFQFAKGGWDVAAASGRAGREEVEYGIVGTNREALLEVVAGLDEVPARDRILRGLQGTAERMPLLQAISRIGDPHHERQ